MALLYGLGIVGDAFLLSWAAEAAQVDVSASITIAVLALIALLPEYTIKAVLAWTAGSSYDPSIGEVTSRMELVAANVTGANRLFIGVGWPIVILVFWLNNRRDLNLKEHISLELPILIAATLLTLFIFFMGQVHLILAGILILIYLYYLWSSARKEPEKPELVGPAAFIGSLSNKRRPSTVILLFLYSASIILVSAEPFVESLIISGEHLGIDEFILIQ